MGGHAQAESGVGIGEHDLILINDNFMIVYMRERLFQIPGIRENGRGGFVVIVLRVFRNL